MERGRCTMCGKCCEAISIEFTKKSLIEHPQGTPEDRELVANHWHRLSEKKAFEINPFLKLWKKGHPKMNYYYSCDNYDKDTRRCKVHGSQPPVCSGYPWYNEPIDSRSLLYTPECGYQIDLERAKLIDILKMYGQLKKKKGSQRPAETPYVK